MVRQLKLDYTHFTENYLADTKFGGNRSKRPTCQNVLVCFRQEEEEEEVYLPM